MDLFDGAGLGEAAARFGLDRGSLEELEGSNFVYEGRSAGRPLVLKISPGYLPSSAVEAFGSTEAQILGELEFVEFLASRGPSASARPGRTTTSWTRRRWFPAAKSWFTSAMRS